MRTSARCAALFTVLFLGSCAGSIKPSYVDPRVYSELDCAQIQAEYEQTNLWLGQWGAFHNKQIVSNAGSLALFGLQMPLGTMRPSEIASLKGRVIALQQVASDKQCELPLPKGPS